MQTQKHYLTLNIQSFIDQRPNNSKINSQLQQKLQQKLTLLQSNYSKMESDYFKKIKDLKLALIQRTRKQSSLTLQVNSLRDQFKNHQLQIKKLTEELVNEQTKSIQHLNAKKNFSPSTGLIRKSLEGQKRIDKRMSPTNPTTLITKINKNIVNTDTTSKQVQNKKGVSPMNNYKKIINVFSNQQYQVQQKTTNIKQVKINKVIKRSPQNQNKKAFSPNANNFKSGIDLKGFLQNNLKYFDNQKQKGVINNSPKRMVRKSPNAVTAKPQKKGLGNLKEEMEAF